MRIEKTTTGLIIHDASDIVKRKVLQYFSLSNPVREFFVYQVNGKRSISNIKGYIEDSLDHASKHTHDSIYITSGFLNIRDQVINNLPSPRIIQPRLPSRVDIKMNRQPRSPLQEDCIKKMIMSRSHKLTVELKPGTGKAEPYSRKIPTPTENGYTLMGDLKVGDYVFDRTGNLTKILQIFEQGEQDVYKITFQDGRVAYCEENHLWTVKSHKNGIWKTVMTKDMLRDFKRISPWKQDHGREDPYDYKYRIPVCEPVNYPKREVPIDPWVLGCFISNGCCTEKYLAISSRNDEVPEKIAMICGFTYKRNNTNYTYYFYDSTGNKVKTADFFNEVPSLVNCYSRDKSIPEMYMVNSVETRLALLQGLMDTDGSISLNDHRFNVRYTSTSKTLLKQVIMLLNSFGYSGTITEDSRSTRCKDGYYGSITFRIPNNVKRYLFRTVGKSMLATRATSLHQENLYSDLLIKDIRFSHREKCRCIMVDNDEHLYLTEDYIVTHNTFIALYAIAQLGMKPLIVCPTTLLKNQWIENLVELGIDENDIAKNIYDGPDKTLTVVTVSSIENAIRDDWDGLLKIISKAAYGIKVVDESHLHLKGVLKLDAICNIPHNWYLSATLGRSDPMEDRILNQALSDADRFIGNSKYEEYQKQYVNIYLQDIYYYPSNKLCNQCFKYGSKGLIRASYYNMLMSYKNGEPFIQNIVNVTKRAKGIITYDGKILVLVPLIAIIDKLKEYMERDPFFKDFTFAGVDGSMPLSQRRDAMEADFILSTSMSMGTGVDVSNLAAVVNFDQYSSPIINEQIFGRLRDRGKETWYIDVCDHVKQARMIENWGRKRRSLMPYFPGAHTDIKLLPKIVC